MPIMVVKRREGIGAHSSRQQSAKNVVLLADGSPVLLEVLFGGSLEAGQLEDALTKIKRAKILASAQVLDQQSKIVAYSLGQLSRRVLESVFLAAARSLDQTLDHDFPVLAEEAHTLL